MQHYLLNPAERFFYENAGYSYNANVESAEQGKRRCARELAAAETWARDAGYSFRWEVDPFFDSSEWSDDPEPWAQWMCTMHGDDGEIVQHLGGVDFGRDGSPWGNAYRRVVEAELAHEQQATAEPRDYQTN